MKKKIGKNNRIVIILWISAILLFILTNCTFAFDAGYYNPGTSSSVSGTDKLTKMANIIIGALQIIGTILSVAVLGVLGIKYMVGSVEEKAEYKKTLKPYVIGAVMVFGISNILAIVVKIAGQL